MIVCLPVLLFFEGGGRYGAVRLLFFNSLLKDLYVFHFYHSVPLFRLVYSVCHQEVTIFLSVLLPLTVTLFLAGYECQTLDRQQF